MRIVVAIGGNMISDASDDEETYDAQQQRIQKTAKTLLEIYDQGHDLILTHGNGPQVGSLLLQQQHSTNKTTQLPLRILGALTQGQIGVTLQHAIINELRSRNDETDVVVIPTTVIVDAEDEAFDNPSKPVGPFYSEKEYNDLDIPDDHTYTKFSKGYRRVVPSPFPQHIQEADTINQLSKEKIVISVGGGGSPTINENGKLSLVDAVIDKDLASAQLAKEVDAHLLLILTNVEGVYTDFGTDNEQLIDHLPVVKAQQMIDQGRLGKGSMEPKVRAGIEFSSRGNTIITSPELALDALAGNTGTTISS